MTLRGTEGVERRLGGAAFPLDHSQERDQRSGQLSHQHAAAYGSDRLEAHDADLGPPARTAQSRPGISPERRSARSSRHRLVHARTSGRSKSDGRGDAVYRRAGASARGEGILRSADSTGSRAKIGARSRARPTTVTTTASAPVRWDRRAIRMAVVDQRLRVHGMQNLWVGDASIMPVVSRANTNLTSIMIGERLADFVQEVA